MKKLTLPLILIVLIFQSGLLAKDAAQVFAEFKETQFELDQILAGRKALSTAEKNEAAQLNSRLSKLKQELKASDSSDKKPVFKTEAQPLDLNFELLDFYLYDYSTSSNRVVARLRCKSKIYSDFVKLRFNYYQNSVLAGTDYSYIDYETYGYTGMLPFGISIIETFSDKVEFDSIGFEISYNQENGMDDIFWDQILEVESSTIEPWYSSNHWFGSIKNNSGYAVQYPLIYACIFKEGNLIGIDYTYLDVTEAPPDSVEIFAVTTQPIDSQQVSIINSENYSVDLSGWTIGTPENPSAFTIPEETSLLPGEIIQFVHEELGFEIDTTNAKVILANQDGTIIDEWEPKNQSIPDVKIYSVTRTPTDEEQVTLINYSSFDADISNWTIGDKNNPTAYIIPGGTILIPGATMMFDHSTLGFGINDKGEIIYLKNPDGITVDEWYGPTSRLAAHAAERLLPGTSAVFDSYITLPEDYDEIKYYLNYSLGSLEGLGNIPANQPVFTQMAYSGKAGKAINFGLFLIDHEDDPVQVRVDWGDGSAKDWSNSFPSRSVAALTHTYEQGGTYQVTAQSTDGSGTESTWSDTLTVEITPSVEFSILTEKLKYGSYMNAYEDTIKIAGGIIPFTWNIAEGVLPEGLTLNKNSGIISGIPGQSGEFKLTVIATDGSAPAEADTMDFTLTILNSAPQITSADSIAIFEGDSLVYTALAVDAENNPLTFSYENYPEWLSPAESTISGSVPKDAASTSFVVIVSDGELADSLLVFVKVIEVNEPPQIVSAKTATGYADSLFEYTARAIDPEGLPVAFTFINYPAWLTPADSVIAGIPPAGAPDTSFVIIASDGEMVDTMRVAVTVISPLVFGPEPKILSIKDIADDEGKQVRVIWQRSVFDTNEGDTTIAEYALWRKVTDFSIPGSGLTTQNPVEAKQKRIRLQASDGLWDFVTSVPAHQFDLYSYVAPTLADSSDKGISWSVFFVSAYTENVKLYFDSAPDSGYSVDNSPPEAPTGLLAHHSGGTIRLQWRPNHEADLKHYAIFRSVARGFNPEKLSAPLAICSDTTFSDVPDDISAVYCYRLAACDLSGNLSQLSEEVCAEPASALGDASGLIPDKFALSPNYPNPFNPATIIEYQLPEAAVVTFSVFSTDGKQVRTLIAGEKKTAGRHQITWDGQDEQGMPVASGIYFYQLTSGAHKLTGKMIKLK